MVVVACGCLPMIMVPVPVVGSVGDIVLVSGSVLASSCVVASAVVEVMSVASGVLVSIIMVVSGTGTEQSGAIAPLVQVTRTFTQSMAICFIDRKQIRLNMPSASISCPNTKTMSRSVS